MERGNTINLFRYANVKKTQSIQIMSTYTSKETKEVEMNEFSSHGS